MKLAKIRRIVTCVSILAGAVGSTRANDCPYDWAVWQCGWATPPATGSQQNSCEDCTPESMCGATGFYYRNFNIRAPRAGADGEVGQCENYREIICADEWTCRWSDAMCENGLFGVCEKDQKLTGPFVGIRTFVEWICQICAPVIPEDPGGQPVP